MTQRKKHIGLLLLTGALISLVLLASSLSNFRIQSGTSLSFADNSDEDILTVEELWQVQTYFFSILKGILALIFLILLIFVVARLIVLVNIKIILLSVLVMGILLAIVYLIPATTPGQSAVFPNESLDIATPTPYTYPVATLGRPPQILFWLVIIGIVLGLSLPAIKLVKDKLGRTLLEDELLQEAENAVHALQVGMDFRNVIMRCYMQMARSLQEELGIERNFSMTVREFEDWLEYLGFPTVPVHQLITLFEKVRYGEHDSSDDDEKNAIESLNEIIDFCRTEKVMTNG